jgi:dTDP-4-dehydrorhamnose 3,5-epimerase
MPMEVRKLQIEGPLEIVTRKFGDARGYFSETFSRPRFAEAGIDIDWVQDNQSFSADQHVLRGLHFQVAPFAQDKLVRVLKGSIFDVLVDLRKGSPTYGKWESCVLTADARNQLLVPKGFAHGFLTLEPGVEVFYKVSAPYAPECDRGIRWDDPSIGIVWPLDGKEPVLSAKDAAAPLLAGIADRISF